MLNPETEFPARFIWLDGKPVPWADANIHVASHGILYGTAVFEGQRAYETDKGTALFRFNAHYDRHVHSAEGTDIEVPSREIWKEAHFEVLEANGLKSGYLRPVSARGVRKPPFNLYFGAKKITGTHNYIIAIFFEYGHSEARVVVVNTSRPSRHSMDLSKKINGNYFSSCEATTEAVRRGYDEALQKDGTENKWIAEGPGYNFVMVDNGRLVTPPKEIVLSGITLDTVIDIAKLIGIETERRYFTVDDLLKGASEKETFFCGTASEIKPILKINDVTIGSGRPGPLTQELQRIFKQVIEGKHSFSKDWLEYR